MNDDKKKKVKQGETFFIPSREFLKKLNGLGFVVRDDKLIKLPEAAKDLTKVPADVGRGSDDNV